MKMIVAFVAILLLLLVVALRPKGSGQHRVSEGRLVSVESRPSSKPVRTCRASSHTLQASQPAKSAHAIFLATVEAETDPDRKSEALERAAESVSEADLPAILDWLARSTNTAAAEFCEPLLRRWVERDAPAAAAWAAQLPEGPASGAALQHVAIVWANSDLLAASAWVHALAEGDSKNAVTLDLAYEAARTEPVTALELASALPPTRERDDLLVHSVSQWAGTDSAAAGDWAMKVSDSNVQPRLVAAVAIASAEQDGAGAATLVVNGLVAGEEQDRAAISIVQRWVQNSPQAAASWVSQFPDLPSRDAAVQNLLALWTTQDAAAAGSWLRELPTGSLRDAGIIAYAQALAACNRTAVDLVPTEGK